MDIEKEEKTQDKLNNSYEDKLPEVFEFKIEITDNSVPKSNEKKICVEYLIIGIYELSSLYLEGKIKANKGKVIGRINFLKSKQISLATIYMVENQMIGIVFNTQLQEYIDYDFSKAIFQYFQANQVIVLDVIGKQLLKNQVEDKQNKFENKNLRVIQTTAHKNKKGLVVACNLEPGNAQSGLAADIISSCEINQRVAYVYYGITTEYQYGLEDIKIFSDIDKKLLPLLGKSEFNMDEMKIALKKYNKMKTSNNLYL